MTFSTMYVSSNRCSLKEQFMLCMKLAYIFGRYGTLQFMLCMKLVYTFGRYSTLQCVLCMKLMYTFGRYSTLCSLLEAGVCLCLRKRNIDSIIMSVTEGNCLCMDNSVLRGVPSIFGDLLF